MGQGSRFSGANKMDGEREPMSFGDGEDDPTVYEESGLSRAGGDIGSLVGGIIGGQFGFGQKGSEWGRGSGESVGLAIDDAKNDIDGVSAGGEMGKSLIGGYEDIADGDAVQAFDPSGASANIGKWKDAKKAKADAKAKAIAANKSANSPDSAAAQELLDEGALPEEPAIDLEDAEAFNDDDLDDLLDFDLDDGELA